MDIITFALLQKLTQVLTYGININKLMHERCFINASACQTIKNPLIILISCKFPSIQYDAFR